MSRQRLTNDVIQYLQRRNFKFTRFLGAGGFADIIGVLDPSGREVAVKIVQRQDIWAIEDKYWPRLKHPYIIEVYDVIKIKDLAVRLYIMPILPRSLDQIIESKEFKNDPDSFKRMNKWIFQILSAVGYLHTKGLAHLDIKTDNVLIDSDDNAVLADFTGLNFTKDPIERLISPDVFHPPECFVHPANKNIRGECFDMWTYGLLVLNAMTGHYFAKKATFSSCSMNWSTHLLPILQKALKKSKFEKLMKKAFPKARLSATDLNVVHHFTQFLLNVKQEERPTAVRAKRHLLMKKVSNPFTQDLMQSMSPKFNPFKKAKRQPDRYSHGDVSSSEMKTDDCLPETTQDEGRQKEAGSNDGWLACPNENFYLGIAASLDGGRRNWKRLAPVRGGTEEVDQAPSPKPPKRSWWKKSKNVTPDSRQPVHFVDDPELAYVIQRYREVHDLVHTLLGTPTNMVGETAVKWVEAIQTRLPMCIAAALLGPLRFRPKQRQKHVTSYLPWAINCGFKAKFLMNVYFEKRWEEDLEKLRKELNIPPLPA